ncbi:MAG TPA: hypothetical protein VLQ46_09330, partial [Casimicrobiaceae bacterium]|nr:hypothetical protein [Casimicrobiaceae bacterium]
YTVIDDASRIVLAGVVRPAADARFRIDVPRKLAPGSYTVLAEIVVDGNAMNADIRRIPLLVTPAAR